MTTVVLGQRPRELEEFLRRRHELGQDGFDEVWEGVYHVAPMAHPWHGYLDNVLAELLGPLARRAGLVGTGPFNLGAPGDFRVPDRGYHQTLPSTTYVPSAVIVVEVVSPDDETWAKFGFYAAHGVHEICTADPHQAQLRWFVRGGDHFVESEASEVLGVAVTDLAAAIDWPH
jgi:Uma2 family endonuclease